MTIEVRACVASEQAIVWRSPTVGRRYFSKAAAISAEARALIYRKHPIEKAEYHGDAHFCTYAGYNIQHNEPEYYSKLLRRVKRIVRASLR